MATSKRKRRCDHFEAAATLSQLKKVVRKNKTKNPSQTSSNKESVRAKGGNSYKCGRCCMGESCLAPTQQLRAEHTCPDCKEIVHVLCAIFDQERDTYVCKKCHQSSSSVASTTSKKESGKPSDGIPNPLKNATMDDVIITKDACNIIANNRKSQGTRLQSINKVSILAIQLQHLRIFCTQVGIKGMRKKAKMDISNAIVEAKVSGSYVKLQQEAEDSMKRKIDAKNNNATMNRRRYINVLFGDVIRPKLATLGTPLERKDLDKGIKTDQLFHEAVLTEYNNESIIEYGQNAFPNLTKGRSVPPSHFQEIDDWKKSRESLKHLCREYDKCFKDWKQSGFHDKEIPTDIRDMTEVADKPFEKFANSAAILYLHEYVYQFPSILNKVTGKFYVVI